LSGAGAERRLPAIRGYAQLILGVRDHLARRPGTDEKPRVRIVHVLQEVIELCRDSSDVLRELAEKESGGSPIELYAVRTCLLSLLMAHRLGLKREHLIDIGVAALFHVLGIAPDAERIDRDALRASVARLFLEMPAGRSAYTRAAIVAEHARAMQDPSQSAGSRPPHVFSRIVGAAAAYQQMVTGFGQDAGLRLHPLDALSIMRENREGRFDDQLVDLLINELGVHVAGPSRDRPLGAGRAPVEQADNALIVTPSLAGLLADLRQQEDKTAPAITKRLDATGDGEEPAKIPLLPPGTIIGQRYRITDCIGLGGMGVVYRCDHTVGGMSMAVKVLRPELSLVPSAAERFLREARAAYQLDHPNIVRVSDVGQEPNGLLFFAMELLEGRSLHELIVQGPQLSIDAALDITSQMLDAIAHAHSHDIVHRDLKPENMIVISRARRPWVKLFDFGIAKVAWDSTMPITRTGSFLGTPYYVAPEQASGEAVDHRADVYSAGVILYELLAGRVPFAGKNIMSVLMQHAMHPPPPLELSTGHAVFEHMIEAVIVRAMAKEPAERYQSAEEMKRALDPVRAVWSSRGSRDPGPQILFDDPVELDEDIGIDTSE
jgi:hypothetical protein